MNRPVNGKMLEFILCDALCNFILKESFAFRLQWTNVQRQNDRGLLLGCLNVTLMNYCSYYHYKTQTSLQFLSWLLISCRPFQLPRTALCNPHLANTTFLSLLFVNLTSSCNSMLWFNQICHSMMGYSLRGEFYQSCNESKFMISINLCLEELTTILCVFKRQIYDIYCIYVFFISVHPF